MGLHAAGKTSFFRRSLSLPSLSMAASRQKADQDFVQDSAEKKAQLRQIAGKLSWYLHHVISLEDAESKSFDHLQAFVFDQNTLTSTSQLLKDLEQTKNLFLPLQNHPINRHWSERVFLSAYLIRTKFNDFFDSPSDIDELLFFYANEMLLSFEELCRFMDEVCTMEVSRQQELSRLQKTQNFEQALEKKSLEDDSELMIEVKIHLDEFSQHQMAYYETFSQWDFNSRLKLTKTCIAYYIQLESSRFALFCDPDPRVIEMYVAMGKEQEMWREEIKTFFGLEGLQMLAEELQETQVALEAGKWTTVSDEVLMHELALNPEFKFPAESCIIHPIEDINAAIAAVIQKPSDLELMLDVFEEIRFQIASLVPYNGRYILMLEEELSREVMIAQIEAMGLERGLYRVACDLIERIKELEAPIYESETVFFQQKLSEKILSGENTELLLRETVDFFYRKISQINLGIKNEHLQQIRTLVAHDIVSFEQEKFRERRAGYQFNLASVLGLIDSIIQVPTKYRLDTSRLCSEYIGTYVAHAIFLDVLQRSGHFDLQAIPETLYLDRARLSGWHRQYQQIFFTAAALGTFCQQYRVNLSSEEMLDQKRKLMDVLAMEETCDPHEVARDIVSSLSVLSNKKGKPLSELDEQALTTVLETIYNGNHPVAEIMNKRLGDELWHFFLKGELVETSSKQLKLYGLQEELSQLGQEIIPLLRLHVKVHGEFYQHSVDKRLWKSLFVVFRTTPEPGEFPALLSIQRAIICEASTLIHKMAFLLTGLSFIQQKIAYADMWNMHAVMKHSTMKALANSFGLIEMMNDPRISKDMMEIKLIELMKYVSEEQEVPFDEADEQDMIKMLCLAKQSKSPGYHAFLDDLIEMYKQFIIKGEMPQLNPNQLTAEFADDIKSMSEHIGDIIVSIKQAHRADEVDPIAPIIPTLRTGEMMVL